MELMMSAVNGVFAVAEVVVDTIAQFFQREDVKRAMVKGQQVAQGIALVVSLVAVVVGCFVICSTQALYRAWAAELPGAIAAFKAGYAGIETDVAPEALVLAPALVETVVVVETAKPSSQELRKQCEAAGIKWRNANGKNKHLTIAQMQAALAGVEDFANV